MIDLPTIVEAIRRQRPAVVPEWLEMSLCEVFYKRGSNTSHRIDMSAAQSIIEAALWRALRRKQSTQSTSRRRGYESCGVWIGPTNGHWYAKTGRLHAKAVDFGDDELALVRALCHAIGIEVASA